MATAPRTIDRIPKAIVWTEEASPLATLERGEVALRFALSDGASSVFEEVADMANVLNGG
jgi:hypothetical protein